MARRVIKGSVKRSTTQPIATPSRGPTSYKGYLWIIRSYRGRQSFVAETTHASNASCEIELEAIEESGRYADVFEVTSLGGWAYREDLSWRKSDA